MRLLVIARLGGVLCGLMATSTGAGDVRAQTADYDVKAMCAPIEDNAARASCFANKGKIVGCQNPIVMDGQVVCMDAGSFPTASGQLQLPQDSGGNQVPVAVSPKASKARPTREAVLSAIKDLPSIGGWSIRNEQSPITDTEDVTLMLSSDNEVDDDLGGTSPAYLFIRCQEDATDVFLTIGSHWFHREHLITTRVDTKKAESDLWGGSTSNKAAFHPRPITFIKELAKANKLVVQVAPINSGNILAKFSLDGLTAALKPLRMACGWGG